MADVMLDLETMGTGPNAAIIAIGAVEFDLTDGRLGREFYRLVDLQSSVDCGGVIDPSTVMWWMQQGDNARLALCQDVSSHINLALTDFSAWLRGIGQLGEVNVWGNGAAFDNVVLASAYRRSQLLRPWEFWNDRCYRTVKGMHPEVAVERSGTHHNALDDAITQARHLVAMLRPTVPA